MIILFLCLKHVTTKYNKKMQAYIKNACIFRKVKIHFCLDLGLYQPIAPEITILTHVLNFLKIYFVGKKWCFWICAYPTLYRLMFY